jgi:ABC-type cobalamin/Fe3+-siderophores transport system ATPase subunit
MARLTTDHLELGYGDRTVVADLSLTLPKGKITALVGANGSGKSTLLRVLHDLNQASRYAHHLVAIAQGRVAVEGPPDMVMNPEMLRRVFAVEADALVDPRSGAPMCVPHALRPHANPDVGL